MTKILINFIIFLIITIIYNKSIPITKEIKFKKIISLAISLILSTLLTVLLTNNNNLYITSVLSNITIITLYKILIDRYNIPKNITYNSCLIYILIGLSISFILEVTIFNYKYYESLNYEEIILTNPIMDGITKKDNAYTISETKLYTIEYQNINKKIHNIKIDYKNKTNNLIPIKMTLYANDEMFSEYFELSEITILNKVEKSKVKKLNLSEKTKNLRLDLVLTKGVEYIFDDIHINVKVPLEISFYRIAIITILILLFYIFRPSSSIYKQQFLTSKNKILIALYLVVGELIICTMIFFTNTIYMSYQYHHHNQYAELAHSFQKGKTYLDIPISEKLLSLKNPYDNSERTKEGLIINEDYEWDTAYYNGKYYVYFGVLPVITAYLPYNIITNKDLQNHNLCYIVGILTIISSIYLIYQITKRWFKTTSIGMFLLTCNLFLNASGLLLIFKCHDLYSVPILYGLLLSTSGLGLWISSYNIKNHKHNLLKLTFGSLLLALTSTCRPQFLITTFLIFPLFFSYFFKEGKWDKRKITELICLLLPYIIVAIPLMFYNYVRFSSPFDFGANYNLTTNDMRQRGFKIDRIPTGIFYYLFSIPIVSPIFPFLEIQSVRTTYLGATISEGMIGGFLTGNIITYLCFISYKIKNQFPDKKVYYLSVLTILFAFLLVILDTEMSGILPRYYTDFSWLFLISTILVIFTLNKKYSKSNTYTSIILLLITLSCVYNILFAIVEETQIFAQINPTLFEQLKYLICFWL